MEKSLGEANQSVATQNKGSVFRKIAAFIGPAYLVSVGYMDPGNWATDIAGGSQFGYTLLWVLLMSNLMALLLQSLSARLGIVTQRDLAQASRETYSPFVNYILYFLAEIAIAACDLAEVLGMAIGINLLFGIPLLEGVLITVLDTFLLLFLINKGIRKMEAFIIVLVAIIGFSFIFEMLFAQPEMGQVVQGLIPSIPNESALYIAIGIIGATVMPHNLYLHSALVQTRKINRDVAGIRKSIFYNFIDSAVALNAAFFVNAAILILAATAFFATGHQQVAKIEDAHALLAPLLGSKLAPILFAVALIAAGQSSTVTGTLAGQIVMEGYLKLRLNPWIRRLITRLVAIIPAVLVIGIMGEERVDALLIFSQVILSLQLGYAVIPLIHFVSDKTTMGEFAINWKIKVLAWLVATVLVYLNGHLVYDFVIGFMDQTNHLMLKILLVVLVIFFIVLLIYITIFPFFNKSNSKIETDFHGDNVELDWTQEAPVNRIAIAVDFSASDKKLIKTAIAHAYNLHENPAQPTTEFIFIHVVESATAKYLLEASDDAESRKDQERLNAYVLALEAKGYKATTALGYQNRVKEIVRIVQSKDAQLLVMGAHRHQGWKDYLFGETIESVRHKVTIPVLIVNH